MIEINDLNKYYGSKLILKDISMSLTAGEVVGIIGKNGAGKSTLFKCISGLEKYHGGDIKSKLNPLKDHIGYLPTVPFFFSKLTGLEYLRLVCHARSVNDIQFEQKNIFDLPLNEYTEYYSTGMKKKLALMGLLFQRNEILILDEPFNGVDIESNTIIFELLKALKTQEKAIVISSHIFGSLKEICGQIYLLQDSTLSQPYSKDAFHILEESFYQDSIGSKVTEFFST